MGPVVGHVATSGTTVLEVSDLSAAVSGRVLKTKSGAWKVMRGTRKIGVVKANGSRAYPANFYNPNGVKVACAGLKHGVWWVYRLHKIYGTDDYLYEILASAPKSCPARAALGAVRLVFWK